MTAAEGTTTSFRLSVSRIVSVAPNGGAIFGGMTVDEKPLRVLAGAHVLVSCPADT